MKNDPLCSNPPAIVKAAEEWSINDVKADILEDHGHQQRHAAHSIEYARRMGEKLLKIKGRLAHGQFQGWVEKNMPFNIKKAQRCMRIARDWENIVKNDNVSFLDVDESLKLLTEDVPEQGHEKSGTVPYPVPDSSETGQIREPGEDESYQELQAKKQEVLCKRCKIIKVPACDQCRVRWFNLDNPKPKAESTAAPPPKKPKADPDTPANGQVLFDWGGYKSSFGAIVRQIDLFGNAYKVNLTPEAEGLRRRLGEWHKDFTAWTKQITKQQPPE